MRRIPQHGLCLAFVMLTLAGSVEARVQPTCAVLPFATGEGVTTGRAQRFADLFSTEIERTDRFTVLDRPASQTALDQHGLPLREGCSSPDCALAAGRLLGVEYVIFGEVGKTGVNYFVHSYMMDVVSGAIVSQATTYRQDQIDRALSYLAMYNMQSLVLAGISTLVDLGAGLSMELVWIPAGGFIMGSAAAERAWAAGPEGQGDASWFSGEGGDPRTVAIFLPFWLGRTEVTYGQWNRFIDDTKYVMESEKRGSIWTIDWEDESWDWREGYGWRNPNYRLRMSGQYPVTSITWNDAMAFCAWLTERERDAGRVPDGYEYRLPTEAEWEYACRGGQTQTRFWWGDVLEDGEGRLNAAANDGPTEPRWNYNFPWMDGFETLSPTDAYGARGRNGFGLADMLGNVWEWCLDSYHPDGPGDTPYMGDPTKRVLRGGAFNSAPGMQRCAYRTWNCPTLPFSYYGLRVCLGPAVDPGRIE